LLGAPRPAICRGQSLSAIERDAPTAYQAAHDEVARDENDLLHFAAHVLQTTTKAQQRSADKSTRLAEEQHAAASLPVAAKNLNPRQSLLVARALKEPAFRRTLQEHARDYNLARQTSRNDFAPLVKLGWFEEAKIGRALAFFPAPDLAARVQASLTERT
jgi:Fic family protein